MLKNIWRKIRIKNNLLLKTSNMKKIDKEILIIDIIWCSIIWIILILIIWSFIIYQKTWWLYWREHSFDELKTAWQLMNIAK